MIHSQAAERTHLHTHTRMVPNSSGVWGIGGARRGAKERTLSKGPSSMSASLARSVEPLASSCSKRRRGRAQEPIASRDFTIARYDRRPNNSAALSRHEPTCHVTPGVRSRATGRERQKRESPRGPRRRANTHIHTRIGMRPAISPAFYCT